MTSSTTIDDVAVVYTPTGGWTVWPEPVLAGCSDPVVDGAPDLDGWWRIVEVVVDGATDPNHRLLGHIARHEQAGDRLVVTAGGVIHDMRCDGTADRGVNDVAEFDKATPITVVATYEDEVHVLRPVGMPIEVRRWRDGEHLMWQYVGFTARMEWLAPSATASEQVMAIAEAATTN